LPLLYLQHLFLYNHRKTCVVEDHFCGSEKKRMKNITVKFVALDIIIKQYLQKLYSQWSWRSSSLIDTLSQQKKYYHEEIIDHVINKNHRYFLLK